MTIPVSDIIDPPAFCNAKASKCPNGNFIRGVKAAGLSTLIPNCPALLTGFQFREQLFPLTVNDNSNGGSYVVQPHSAYIGFAKDELRHSGFKFLVPLLKIGLTAIGWPLSVANLNRVLMVDNFCVATNLHGNWDGANLSGIRRSLVSRFPDHLIAIRSVDSWSCRRLFEQASDDGWLMMPARQIWVIDDPKNDWAKKSAVKSDRNVLRKSKLRIEEVSYMSEIDSRRISELYHALYIVKYSSFSPRFSPSWIRLLHESRLVRFRVARDSNGKIVAVAGCFARGDIVTAPVIGYDMSYPRDLGLYRIANLMVGDFAIECGFRLHASSGAGEFKRLRGARSQIEYTAFWTGHLSKSRQMTLRAFSKAVETFAIPFLVAREL